MESWQKNKKKFEISGLLFDIDEDYYVDILNLGDSLSFVSGETVFRQGDPALMCYIVTEGSLKLIKLHDQGKEAILRYISPGDFTAGIAVFKERDYPVTAKAVNTAKVVGWKKKTMVKLMHKYPQLAINMLRLTIDRIDELQTRYLEISADQVERRIAHALLRLMKQFGKKNADGIIIDFCLSRQELADYTGTTLYTVSRTLSAWKKKGWVKSGRKQVIITDPHALVLFSENS